MINKIIHNITAILATTAILINSLAQFHHHLSNGNVCIVYEGFIESIVKQECPVQKHCNHENYPAPESQKCFFKLDFFNFTNQYNHGIILPTILAIWTHLINVPVSSCFDTTSNKHFYYRNILTHIFKIGIASLRSPPILTK